MLYLSMTIVIRVDVVCVQDEQQCEEKESVAK